MKIWQIFDQKLSNFQGDAAYWKRLAQIINEITGSNFMQVVSLVCFCETTLNPANTHCHRVLVRRDMEELVGGPIVGEMLEVGTP